MLIFFLMSTFNFIMKLGMFTATCLHQSQSTEKRDPGICISIYGVYMSKLFIMCDLYIYILTSLCYFVSDSGDPTKFRLVLSADAWAFQGEFHTLLHQGKQEVNFRHDKNKLFFFFNVKMWNYWSFWIKQNKYYDGSYYFFIDLTFDFVWILK